MEAGGRFIEEVRPLLVNPTRIRVFTESTANPLTG